MTYYSSKLIKNHVFLNKLSLILNIHYFDVIFRKLFEIRSRNLLTNMEKQNSNHLYV